MEKLDRKLIFIGIALLALLALGWLVFRIFDFHGIGRAYSIYTLEDFPQVNNNQNLGRNDKTRFITELNIRYKALASGESSRTEYQNWLDIGIYKKALGDFEGAEAAWLEAAKLIPNPYLAYGDLADLYLSYIKNLNKAESYYKKAIALSPPNLTYYKGLADLYRYEWFNTHGKKVEPLILDAVKADAQNKEVYYKYLIDFFNDQGNQQKVDEYAALLK